MPGTYQAIYNGTKAFLDSISFALRHEVEERVRRNRNVLHALRKGSVP
jgi:short-subunit dehydrogenase